MSITPASKLPSENQRDGLPTTEPHSPSNASATKISSSSWRHNALSHLTTDITLEKADLPIIATCLVSGLCDSSAYNAWECFVSMQTANTIFLALGASGHPITRPYGWLKSLISISSFLLGCFVFANTRSIKPKARGTLAISFVLQSICIIIAAALVKAGIVPSPKGLQIESGDDINFLELIPLAFLAFQSGGQIVT
ncbi:hypothetical protein HYALB_00013592 [Hymenoscyphus albidus]|uniref:DUF1275 domain protein n=1 Tax=Hymenoscyphus albidus TaxID=595503 RepID=A0A9N9QAZ4_9HELO|nr:hypothetical protein HYALB_00013592 [Hymenoscyphus albidus]